MVNGKYRRGSATPRRSRMAHYARRRQRRLGATSTGSGFKTVSPHFMRRVKNRPALRRRGIVHAMIRPIVVVAALVALAYGGHFGYRKALTSPALSIQSVRLHQVPTMLMEPVRARVQPAYGQNLLALDLAQLRASIEELPAVRSAQVRRVLPAQIVVTVVPRTPKARVVGDAASYIIDTDAVVLDTWDQIRTRLPEIRVVDGGALVSAPGRRLTQDAAWGTSLLDALDVIDWMAQSDGAVPTVVNHLRIEEHGVVLVTSRLEIVVGDARAMDTKMAAVRSLLRANPPAEPSIIDARYHDMLVVTALPKSSE
ncbi:MAG: FtsQ-type POTRA domain-containing protein [Acidobacteriota bacterium]|jgi:hypothetical protein